MLTISWWAAGNAWLCRKATEHFSAWANSMDGKKWRDRPYKNPHKLGYVQPQWMEDARVALGDNDEEAFKAIKLQNL